MTSRSIIFRADMIRAILDGRKTQTRRRSDRWAKAKPGDLVWVKTHRFMPRRESPLTLEVIRVKAERLQDISAEDAIKEGIDFEKHKYEGKVCSQSPIMEFAGLWNSIHGPGAWEKNPWVYVITFIVAT